MIKSAVNTSNNISSKNKMMLANTDDGDIIGRTVREFISVYSKIEKESAKILLVVNEDKTKLMVSTIDPQRD